MKEIHNPKSLQIEMERLRLQGRRIGFVPTMGALHEGHLSLVRSARKENDIVVASIFVNPFQFGPREDLKKYPRPIQNDRRLLRDAKTDYLFYPSAEQMYPDGFSSTLQTGVPESIRGERSAFAGLASKLCGHSRPGHFRGVSTVVAKLFNLVKPRRAYFGEKDYQQSVIIRRMVEDLNFDLEVRVMPTVREKDGLAMSSRNQYLVAQDRRRAKVLSEVLFWVRGQIRSGERDLPRLIRLAKTRLKEQTTRVDYFDIVDPDTLESLKSVRTRMRAVTACFVGKTRLIDNCEIKIPRRS